jgi:hypothetical protein
VSIIASMASPCIPWCDDSHSPDEPCSAIVGWSGRRMFAAVRLAPGPAALVSPFFVAVVVMAGGTVLVQADQDVERHLAAVELDLDVAERDLFLRAVELIGGAP